MHYGKPWEIFWKLCYYRVNNSMILANYQIFKDVEKIPQGLPLYTAKKQVLIMVMPYLAFDNAASWLLIQVNVLTLLNQPLIFRIFIIEIMELECRIQNFQESIS